MLLFIQRKFFSGNCQAKSSIAYKKEEREREGRFPLCPLSSISSHTPTEWEFPLHSSQEGCPISINRILLQKSFSVEVSWRGGHALHGGDREALRDALRKGSPKATSRPVPFLGTRTSGHQQSFRGP